MLPMQQERKTARTELPGTCSFDSLFLSLEFGVFASCPASGNRQVEIVTH